MSDANKKQGPKGLFRAKKVRNVIILILSGIVAFLALILPDIIFTSTYQMEVGDVASQDILAPYSLNFSSNILTENAKAEATSKVEPIYLPADPGIGRHQIEQLRSILYYISIIRQDGFASNDQKVQDISAINEISISEQTARGIIATSDQNWEAIQVEAVRVLEQMMRNTIKSVNVSQVRSSVPTSIDYSLQEDLVAVISEMIAPLIIPNSLYDEEKTLVSKNEAIASVEPVQRTFISGQTLVRRGQIITPEILEALAEFNLIKVQDNYQQILGAGIIVLVICLFIGFYFSRRQLDVTAKTKSILLISLLFLVFLTVARIFVVNRTIIPYIYPIAAFGLTLTILFNLEIGIIFSLSLAALTAYGSPKGFDLTVFYMLPSFIGMLMIGKARRIASFFTSALAIGLIGVGIVLAYRLPDSVTDWIGIATLSTASIVNGLISAGLALFLQYIFSQWLDIVTPLQLIDLTRADHPLLQLLLKNAPGTYQHSLMVSNLAENAAEAINANALLVRTGAIFHDCGKIANPQYFIENQIGEKIDSHDDIDFVKSAATIIQHVSDGVDLARKHRLPTQVIDFMREHHGTLMTRYQYSQAVKSAEDPELVDSSLFRYPGPSPRSKETALLMLADGVEARTRAELPRDDDLLKALINKVIHYLLDEGQLKDTDLTLKDLEIVAVSFFNTLRRIYHPRVKYPEIKQPVIEAIPLDDNKV